ncbi:hypothetical protein GQ43DRAFT_444329 [Delitschia confertaspora ATCC 74209]|uniref:Uncharacterized protein n=1 Tax=Delitschia confertaspora ATCC 74209 TaxID=1513339 RepID=A0A9P4MNV6_9PLEO|nr:hypothetical protein GQ43DRAFT_444329 [Delitschia confertaspora ATCC 74209]
MDSQPPLSQDSQAFLIPSTEVSRSSTPNESDSPAPINMSKAPSPDRLKFTSPAPPTTSSMTPPPSSQISDTRAVARTPTPQSPRLSSPPPTLKSAAQSGTMADPGAALFTPEQISNASSDELRSMVNKLTVALRDVRLSAAHYKLQYNMLVMESQESASRMAVELAMAHREVDVLQQAEEKRRASIASPVLSVQEPPVDAANAMLMNEMNRQVQSLQSENDELKGLLDEQKRITEHREGEIASLMEENDRLKTRIRKNRDHIAPFLPYLEQMSEQGSPRSAIGTPYQATPRHRTLGRAPPLVNESTRGQQPFEALLLADKMLSQETATAPSTPSQSQPFKSRFGHTRGTHSMSSLPQTPNRARSSTQIQRGIPQTPPTFSAINVPQSAPQPRFLPKADHTRRQSSNSTITASSANDEEASTEREDEEVPESQASQMATTMLRKVTKSRSQMSAPSSQSSNSLYQSKLYGRVKKSGVSRPGEMEKRRLESSEHHGSPSKRGRLDGVGLGIGGILRQ